MKGRSRWLIVLAAAIFSITSAAAAEKTASKKAAVPTSRAAVSITNSGIRVNPPTPATGFTELTVTNRTNKTRGLVVYTTDPGGTPAFRYTPLIKPGSSKKITFWMYPGRAYYMKDYTKTWVYGTERKFTSHYRKIVRVPAVAGFGRGSATKPNYAVITITDNGIQAPNIPAGAVKLKIVNDSSKTRGVVIYGKDIAGTPTIRHTKMLAPGQRTFFNTWVYKGNTYEVCDYTDREGLKFQSEFSKTINVPAETAKR